MSKSMPSSLLRAMFTETGGDPIDAEHLVDFEQMYAGPDRWAPTHNIHSVDETDGEGNSSPGGGFSPAGGGMGGGMGGMGMPPPGGDMGMPGTPPPGDDQLTDMNTVPPAGGGGQPGQPPVQEARLYELNPGEKFGGTAWGAGAGAEPASTSPYRPNGRIMAPGAQAPPTNTAQMMPQQQQPPQMMQSFGSLPAVHPMNGPIDPQAQIPIPHQQPVPPPQYPSNAPIYQYNKDPNAVGAIPGVPQPTPAPATTLSTATPVPSGSVVAPGTHMSGVAMRSSTEHGTPAYRTQQGIGEMYTYESVDAWLDDLLRLDEAPPGMPQAGMMRQPMGGQRPAMGSSQSPSAGSYQPGQYPINYGGRQFGGTPTYNNFMSPTVAPRSYAGFSGPQAPPPSVQAQGPGAMRQWQQQMQAVSSQAGPAARPSPAVVPRRMGPTPHPTPNPSAAPTSTPAPNAAQSPPRPPGSNPYSPQGFNTVRGGTGDTQIPSGDPAIAPTTGGFNTAVGGTGDTQIPSGAVGNAAQAAQHPYVGARGGLPPQGMRPPTAPAMPNNTYVGARGGLPPGLRQPPTPSGITQPAFGAGLANGAMGLGSEIGGPAAAPPVPSPAPPTPAPQRVVSGRGGMTVPPPASPSPSPTPAAAPSPPTSTTMNNPIINTGKDWSMRLSDYLFLNERDFGKR